VRLMRLAEKLSDLDALFGTRWDLDFDDDEKQLAMNCLKLMNNSK